MAQVSTTPAGDDAAPSNSADESNSAFWEALKKTFARLQDWFAVQSVAVKMALLLAVILIPASGIYSWHQYQKQAQVAEQVKAMAARAGEGVWTYNKQLPVVFGSGSVLSFLESQPADRITVIYSALSWSVSERFVLIESQGKQYAYYPSDMETKIFTDKAVTAPWGGKITFVPRSELDAASAQVFERLEQRFSGARPQSEKDSWKAGLSALISGSLTLGLLAFLWFTLKGQIKSLKFIEP
ncbi:MAG: AAA family ATPase, partial [Burkholderiaceae bacterium]